MKRIKTLTLFIVNIFFIISIAKAQQNPCNPSIFKDGWIGDLAHTVYPITNTAVHQGSIPVYLNPININFQINGNSGGVSLLIKKFQSYGFPPPNHTQGQYASFQNLNNVFTSSGPSTNYSLNVSNYPPGSYIIESSCGSEPNIKRNRCLPYFIIARTLLNTTILPECAKVGQSIPISWNGGSGDANINLVLRTQRNTAWFVPVNISIPNIGSYNLVIPNTVLPGEIYSVEINDGIQYVTSNLPNGRTHLKICANKVIRGTIQQANAAIRPNIGAVMNAICSCGNWETKKVSYADAIKEIECNGSININRNTSANFNLKYNCSSTDCSTKYEAIVSTPAGQTTTIQIANNQNWSYVFNQIGNYTVTFKTYCNEELCQNSCIYNILVK